jgi:hypothetical protein
VVDHIVPLACGGSDAPSNMQWQNVAEAKAKGPVGAEGLSVSAYGFSGSTGGLGIVRAAVSVDHSNCALQSMIIASLSLPK